MAYTLVAIVLVEDGQTSVKGYYAISNHTVVYEALPKDQADGLPQIDMPVVLIGQLAVDSRVTGERTGAWRIPAAGCASPGRIPVNEDRYTGSRSRCDQRCCERLLREVWLRFAPGRFTTSVSSDQGDS